MIKYTEEEQRASAILATMTPTPSWTYGSIPGMGKCNNEDGAEGMGNFYVILGNGKVRKWDNLSAEVKQIHLIQINRSINNMTDNEDDPNW